MAWQSLTGNGGSNGGNADGGNQSNQSTQPQGTEYTLQGVMRFLQTEWHRHERDRNGWEIERQEMKGRIAKLEGDRRKADNDNTSLKSYLTMLERSVKEREEEVRKRKAEGPAAEGEGEEIKEQSSGKTIPRPAHKPHNSFLEVEGEEVTEHDRERGSMNDYISKSQSELTYLMASPSNPMPPRDAPIEPSYGFRVPPGGSQEYHDLRQNAGNQQIKIRSSPNYAPPMQISPTSMKNDGPRQPSLRPPSASMSGQRPLPAAEEWAATFEPANPEEQMTNVKHSYDPSEHARDSGAPAVKDVTDDGWDFPEPEAKPTRPDQDLFPAAPELPKSPRRTSSHGRRSSAGSLLLSKRKSNEQLMLQNSSHRDSGNFKVRFGLRGHLDAVRSVIFSGGGSPGEPELCTAGDDGTIKRWVIPARYGNAGIQETQNDLDIQSYFTHRGHSGAIMCLTSWSPNQNLSTGGRAQGDGWIFSGGQDATVRVWERGRVDPKATLDGHTDAVWAVCVLPGTTGTVFGPAACQQYGGPDRIILATGAADGTVKVWSVTAPPQLVSPQTGSGRKSARARKNSVSSGSGFPSSPQPSIASDSPFNYTLIHSISRQDSDASPTCITPFSATGEAFVVSYADAAVLVYDTTTGEEIAAMASLETYDGTINTSVNAVVATTNGLDGSLSFDAGRGASEEGDVVGGATGTNGGLGGIIISGHEDRYIRFYDANSGQCTYTMLAHPAAISSLSLSPDGRELVSAGHDASLRFWSLETRSCTHEATSHRLMRGEGICSVIWSQDGRWVVSAGGDGVVKVFDRR